MNKDKAEEKARDNEVQKYADLYRASLTVVESLSTENAQLREALSLIVELTDDMMNAKTDFEYNIKSVERKVLIDKAKELIK